MAGMGHVERFPLRGLSGGCCLGQPTFTGTNRNGEDAPQAAIWETTIGWLGPTPKRIDPRGVIQIKLRFGV
jgi:hypothetical protein